MEDLARALMALGGRDHRNAQPQGGLQVGERRSARLEVGGGQLHVQVRPRLLQEAGCILRLTRPVVVAPRLAPQEGLCLQVLPQVGAPAVRRQHQARVATNPGERVQEGLSHVAQAEDGDARAH